MRLRERILGLVGASAVFLLPTPARAVPISYAGTLADGVAAHGVNHQGPCDPASDPILVCQYDNPDGAEYYRFHATAGSEVTITGSREDVYYDMTFWVFQGLFTDTADFDLDGNGRFQFTDLAFIDVGDDQLPPAIPGGPFGDPQTIDMAPATGWYTVVVTNFGSTGNPPNHFQLIADGIDNVEPAPVPEPGTLFLVGAGIVGLALRRRPRA